MAKGKKQYVQKHLYVPQERIVAFGLQGIGIRGAVVLSYLYGWFRYKGAKTIRVDGARFVWLNYNRLVQSLPLLDLVSACGSVNRRAVRVILDRLAASKLVETYTALDHTIYFRLLPLGLAVFAKDEKSADGKDAEKPEEDLDEPCEDSHKGDVTERTRGGDDSHKPLCETPRAQEQDLPGVDPQAGDPQEVDLTPPAAEACAASPSTPDEDLQEKKSPEKISGTNNTEDPHAKASAKSFGQDNTRDPQSKPPEKTSGTTQGTPADKGKSSQDQEHGRAAGGAAGAAGSLSAGAPGHGNRNPLTAEVLVALPPGTPPHAVPEEHVDAFVSIYDEVLGGDFPREKIDGFRMGVSAGRRDFIKNRLSEVPNLGFWRKVFETAKAAPHCTGQTTGWRMTFGWVIASLEPAQRILEGAYGRPQQVSGRTNALAALRQWAAEIGVRGSDTDSRTGLPN